MLRRRGLRLGPFYDAAAPTILVAQALGRFGNYFNQELFGGPTTLPWGLEIDKAHMPVGYAPGTLFHPTFLYEALWNAAGAVFLVWLGRFLARREGAVGGRLMWAYLMVYTSGRVWIELLRVDEAHRILGLRLNVWTSILGKNQVNLRLSCSLTEMPKQKKKSSNFKNLLLAFLPMLQNQNKQLLVKRCLTRLS